MVMVKASLLQTLAGSRVYPISRDSHFEGSILLNESYSRVCQSMPARSNILGWMG